MRRLVFACLVACSTDTFTGADASSDGSDANACVSNFCASANATTCNDFDETSTPSGWFTDNTSGMTIGTSDTQATSCPRSFEVDVPTMTSPVIDTHAWAIAQVPLAPTVTATFDVLLPKIPTGGGTTDGFAFFSLRTTIDATWSVRLEHNGDGSWSLRLHQGATGMQDTNVENPVVGAWNHMTLKVGIAQDSTGFASLDYQTTDKGQQTATLSGKPTYPGGVASITFAIGALVFSHTSQPYSVLFDSVAIQTK